MAKQRKVPDLIDIQQTINCWLTHYNADNWELNDLMKMYMSEIVQYIGEATSGINECLNNWNKAFYLYCREQLFNWNVVTELLSTHHYKYNIMGTDMPVYQIYFPDECE